MTDCEHIVGEGEGSEVIDFEALIDGYVFPDGTPVPKKVDIIGSAMVMKADFQTFGGFVEGKLRLGKKKHPTHEQMAEIWQEVLEGRRKQQQVSASLSRAGSGFRQLGRNLLPFLRWQGEETSHDENPLQLIREGLSDALLVTLGFKPGRPSGNDEQIG